MKIGGGDAMAILLTFGFALAVLVASELARAFVARRTGVRIERAAQIALHFHGSRRGRAATIAAGPVGAYLAISLLAFVATYGRGLPDDRVFVAETREPFAAHGRLLPGDQLLAVDGLEVSSAAEVLRAVRASPRNEVTIRVLRNGALHDISITPTATTHGPILGITYDAGRTYSLSGSASLAIRFPALAARGIVRGLVDYAAGKDAADPGGPTRIGAELARSTSWFAYVLAAALLATYGLLVLVALDLVRLALLLRRQSVPDVRT